MPERKVEGPEAARAKPAEAPSAAAAACCGQANCPSGLDLVERQPEDSRPAVHSQDGTRSLTMTASQVKREVTMSSNCRASSRRADAPRPCGSVMPHRGLGQRQHALERLALVRRTFSLASSMPSLRMMIGLTFSNDPQCRP